MANCISCFYHFGHSTNYFSVAVMYYYKPDNLEREEFFFFLAIVPEGTSIMVA